MSDVWAGVAELDVAMQQQLAGVLETRGADARQREMRRAFLATIDFPNDCAVLEAGCGTGVLTRVIAELPEVAAVVGADIAPSLLERARELAASLPNVRFEEADAQALHFADASFDVVVFDSTFSHLPDPEAALAEAFRVLRPGGLLAAFDGDYATATVALAVHDPLQAVVDSMMAGSVTDRRVMRRLPSLARACGFEVERMDSHGFIDGEGAYMETVVARGADMLHAADQIGADLAAELKRECRRRIEAGTFFGHIAYASLVARRPA
jgi:SAM-dependent methyltransferase